MTNDAGRLRSNRGRLPRSAVCDGPNHQSCTEKRHPKADSASRRERPQEARVGPPLASLLPPNNEAGHDDGLQGRHRRARNDHTQLYEEALVPVSIPSSEKESRGALLHRFCRFLQAHKLERNQHLDVARPEIVEHLWQGLEGGGRLDGVQPLHLPRVLQGLGLPKGLFGGCENIHAVGGLVVESSALTEAIHVPTVATPLSDSSDSTL